MFNNNNLFKSSLNEEDEFFLQNFTAIKLQIEKGEIISDKNINAILDKWYWSVQVVYGDEYQVTRDYYLVDAEFFFNMYHEMVLLLANKGVSEAQYKLYLYYSKIEQPKQAIDWLTKATENNHLLSIFALIRVYCEGTQEINQDPKKILELSEKFLQVMRNEHSKSISENDIKKATVLTSLNEEMLAYLNQWTLTLDKNMENKDEIKFLCDDKIMLITVHALNQFINTYKSHIDVTKSRWQLANYFANNDLMIKKINSPIRPMAIITFKFASKQATLSENYLYWYLIKMGITCLHHITSTDNSRTCVFSIDDVNILKSIPTQCNQFIDKIIDDYHPIQPIQTDNLSQQKPKQDIDLIKSFLIKLKILVEDKKWNDKAYTLFSYQTPEHIQHLRDELKFFHHKLSDTATLTIFAHVKKEILNIQPKKSRDPEVNDCYNQLKDEINNLFSTSQHSVSNSLK